MTRPLERAGPIDKALGGVVHRARTDAVARPDEKQSPGGFEASAELRRTEYREAEPEAAAVVIVLLAVAVALYLAV